MMQSKKYYSKNRNERDRKRGNSSFPNRFGHGRFSRGNGGSRSAFRSSHIDHNKYVCKAQSQETLIELKPINTFLDFGFSKNLVGNIQAKKYESPTEIQDKAIPLISQGKDLLGQASTGSGKTAAFLLPLIEKTLKNRSEKTLIITPTRELAMQIRGELIDFSRGLSIRSVITIGGADIRRQMWDLRGDYQFVVGTPGRLKDLHERKVLNLSRFCNIVLDEVDRMLDMGFVQDIKFLISQMRQEKQSLMFSATLDPRTETISRSILRDPVKIQIGSQSPAKNVDQDVVKLRHSEEKITVLYELLTKDEFQKVLIFSRTKRGADNLSKKLYERGFKADSIHGDKRQSQRNRVITQFLQNRIDILVATDVAARGLDIPDITHVINYDEPANFDDYIHRIGRTGRAGKKGKALTFVV